MNLQNDFNKLDSRIQEVFENWDDKILPHLPPVPLEFPLFLTPPGGNLLKISARSRQKHCSEPDGLQLLHSLAQNTAAKKSCTCTGAAGRRNFC